MSMMWTGTHEASAAIEVGELSVALSFDGWPSDGFVILSDHWVSACCFQVVCREISVCCYAGE